jgi:hypothetical protein
MPKEEIVEPIEGDTNLVSLVPEAAIDVAVAVVHSCVPK